MIIYLRILYNTGHCIIYVYLNCLCGSSTPGRQDGFVPRPNKLLNFHHPLVSTAKIDNFCDSIIYYFFFFVHSLQDFLTKYELNWNKFGSTKYFTRCSSYWKSGQRMTSKRVGAFAFTCNVAGSILTKNVLTLSPFFTQPFFSPPKNLIPCSLAQTVKGQTKVML